MITLYQLHWSHFVEKVRWALDYKGLPWTAVDVEPFSKREMRHLAARRSLETGVQTHTVPTIHDASNGAVVGESSQILQYLERTYPTPALYPADPAQREEVSKWMLWLDSTLGLAARRLAYTQVAVECPGYLGELFVPHIVRPGAARTLKGRLAGTIIAGVLARRFRFSHNRADGVFELLEQCLLFAARRLREQRFLVGNQFTAADITLAALLRPTGVVPFFRDHPRLQRLFEWRAALVQEHRREPLVGYEIAVRDARSRRGWTRGAVRWMTPATSDDECALTDVPAMPVARNDQHEVGRFPMLRGPLWYLRLRMGCGLGRTALNDSR
jgi:glutathione S-transferase